MTPPYEIDKMTSDSSTGDSGISPVETVRRSRKLLKRRDDVTRSNALRLARVSANFTLGMSALHGEKTLAHSGAWSSESLSSGYHSNATALSSDLSTRSSRSSRSSRRGRSMTSVRQETPLDRRSRHDGAPVPLMLLPAERHRSKNDFAQFVESLRHGSVVAADSRLPVILTADGFRFQSADSFSSDDAVKTRYGFESQATRTDSEQVPVMTPHRFSFCRSSVVSKTSSGSSNVFDADGAGAPPAVAELGEESDEYLDTFATGDSLLRQWQQVRAVNAAKKRRRQARVPEPATGDDTEHAAGAAAAGVCRVCEELEKNGGNEKHMMHLAVPESEVSFIHIWCISCLCFI